MNEYTFRPERAAEGMLVLLRENPDGIVVKPNEGTSDSSCSRVTSEPDLESAVHRTSLPAVRLRFRLILKIENEVRESGPARS